MEFQAPGELAAELVGELQKFVVALSRRSQAQKGDPQGNEAIRYKRVGNFLRYDRVRYGS